MRFIITLIWLLGGLWRIYRQARFFQIEEYQNIRYFRWLLVHPERWPWRRAVIAWGIGVALGYMFSEAPNELLLTLIFGVSGVVAVWPPDEGEIKKAFRRTQRAIRLLTASFVLFGGLSLLGAWLVDGLHLEMSALQFAVAAGAGLILFIASPLFLIGGNVLAYPVEELLRHGFVRRARNTLKRLDPTVIGITGSCGKTSTKHFLTHILSGRYVTVATPKSYNTLMGVCLAINTELRDKSDLDYYVVEMGAYVEGEIAEICQLTHPQISIVTAVGPQHLERFGTMENVANAKYEIVAALHPDGVAILNGDDPLVRKMAERATTQVILVGHEDTNKANLIARNIEESLDGLDFDVVDTITGQERHFNAPVYGIHNVTNILLATAAAQHVGLSLGEIALRVAALEPFEHRLQRKVQPGGITVLDDAYSANPVGARSALRVLGLHHGGRRILITPGMIELGDVEEEENRKLGADAPAFCTDIVLVGVEQTRPIYEGVLSTDFDRDRLHVFESHTEAVVWLRETVAAGDTVLFLNDLPDTYL